LKTETLAVCPVCDGTRLRHVLRVPDFETATGEYGIVGCGDCGVAFTSPRPCESELPALYAGRATADFPRSGTNFVQRLREFAIDSYLRRQLASIVGAKSSVVMLDFGCGDGELCRGIERHARACGYRVKTTAVDFHRDAPTSLASRHSNYDYKTYESWRGTDERYDAIFLRHVLEHHPEPQRLLRELRNVLLPRGRLFVEVPNRRSIWAAVFGQYYFGYYIPRHLMHFDARSLRIAVEASGLRCVSLSLGHTPLIGRSVSYLIGRNVDNLGLFGLMTYPLQIAVDVIGRTSSTLRLSATLDA
jgi:ubiquinone/menaquinone biosynthesis C-methylase UbiE